MIDLNSLKLYTKKISERKFIETANESEIDGLMSDLHQYKISIFPSKFSYRNCNAMCRLNIHRKTGKATLTDLKSTTNINCNAVYDNEFNLHFYTQTTLFNLSYAVENVLKGDGQCLGKENSTNRYYMELEISQLDRIEFFPSWDVYGATQSYHLRFSDAVDVSVECDGEKVFSGTISDLKKYDRVKIVFDSFNKVHLEKFNVGTAEAFKDYY